MKFIIDMTSGGWKEGSEDRLTQIVVSSFNASPVFARQFCSFLAIPYIANSKLSSQYSGINSRADIVMLNANGKVVALIESKTESKTRIEQNKNHEKIKVEGDNYFQITKYPDQIRPSSKWKVLNWTDFAKALRKSNSSKNNFDSRLISGVVEWFREYGFMKNTVFRPDDVKNSSEFIYFFNGGKDEYKKWGIIPGGRCLNSFNALVEAVDFTVSLLRAEMFSDSFFKKKLNGNYRENSHIARSWWIDDFPKNLKSKKAEDYLQWHDKKSFIIQKKIKMKKDSRTGATGLLFGLSFGTLEAGDKKRNPHFVIGLDFGSSWDTEKQIPISKEWSSQQIATEALKIWKKALQHK